MSIWKKHLTLQQLNDFCQHCAVAHLGIEFTAQGDDYAEAAWQRKLRYQANKKKRGRRL